MRRLVPWVLAAMSCRFTAEPVHTPNALVGVPFTATLQMGRSSPTESATGWGCVGHPAGWTATATGSATAPLVAQDPAFVVNKPTLPEGYAWTCFDQQALYSTLTVWVALTPSSAGVATLTWFVESQSGSGSDLRTSSVTVALRDADLDGVDSLAAGGLDCDDARADVYPGATETCDGTDEDCDAVIDDVLDPPTWYFDGDGDGLGDDLIGTPQCDPPGTTWTDLPGDCDDTRPEVYPGATESCDGTDEDCDAVVDDVLDPPIWYFDGDGDGLGDDLTSYAQSDPPGTAWTDLPGDCDRSWSVARAATRTWGAIRPSCISSESS